MTSGNLLGTQRANSHIFASAAEFSRALARVAQYPEMSAGSDGSACGGPATDNPLSSGWLAWSTTLPVVFPVFAVSALSRSGENGTVAGGFGAGCSAPAAC